MTKQELENLVKQVYFQCNNKSPDGLYPVEVDLVEFSEKLIAVFESQVDFQAEFSQDQSEGGKIFPKD